jgi:hypothetical protein
MENENQNDGQQKAVGLETVVRQFYHSYYKTEMKDWIYQKVECTKSKIAELQKELEKYQALKTAIDAEYCPHCNGEGFTREYWDVGEFNTKDCEHCNKTGLVKSA